MSETKAKMLELASKVISKSANAADNSTGNQTVTEETTVDEYGDTQVTKITTTVYDPADLLPTIQKMIEAVNTFEFGLSKIMTVDEQSNWENPHAKSMKQSLHDVGVELKDIARYIPGVLLTKDIGTGGVGRAMWTCMAADLLLSALHRAQTDIKNAGRVELQRRAHNHKAPWEVLAEIQEMMPEDEEIPF